MPSISDKDAITKIKKGEIDYFSVIVKRYNGLIYRYINKKLFDREDTDDLVQEIFINFYKAIERFDENRPVLPYLFQTAINQLKMYFRSKKQTVSLNDQLKIIDGKDDFFSIGNYYQDYLKFLSEKEKKIIQLLREGYSYQEIARNYKQPINTVKSIIRRIRIKIKSYEEQT